MNRIRKKYNFDITTFVCCVAEIFTDISGPLDAWLTGLTRLTTF